MSDPQRSRAMGIAFFFSLALNVFAAAYYFGHMGGMPQRFDHGFKQQVRQLEQPARDTVQQIIDSYRPKIKAQAQANRAAREAIDTALKDPNYSRDKVAAAFKQAKAEGDKLQAIIQQMSLDIAEKLSPEERAKFFDRPRGEKWHGEWRAHADMPPANTVSNSALPQ